MKKLVYFMLFIVLSFSFTTFVFAEKQYIGETIIKDNTLFINGISIPAAQLPNKFVYLPIEDLEYYGFDISSMKIRE